MKKIFIIGMVCVCVATTTACGGQNARTDVTVESTTVQETTSLEDTTQATSVTKPTEITTEKITEGSAEKTEEPETKKTAEYETEASAVMDYSSYLGTWSYKEIPDSIPDEILNNETSYKIYMEHLVSTNVEFKEINGSTVTFVLYKGNIATVAEAFVTGEIINDEIEFNYSDSWNGKGHGTIKLQEDSVHLFCVEEEHGNGRVALNCDETLTRVEN